MRRFRAADHFWPTTTINNNRHSGPAPHILKWELPALIAPVNAQDTQLLIEIRIGSSGDPLQASTGAKSSACMPGAATGNCPRKKNSAAFRSAVRG
jgi:hypothetical protein